MDTALHFAGSIFSSDDVIGQVLSYFSAKHGFFLTFSSFCKDQEKDKN